MTQWAEIPDVRRVTQTNSTDFSDATIEDFITSAQKEINGKVITPVKREFVCFLDNYRQNQINGSNTTFFVKHWYGNYFGDMNFDNQVNVEDVIVIQYDPNTTLETQLVVSSIDVEACSFTLATAPNNVELFVTYAYTPFNPSLPDNFLKETTTYLAGSYLFVGTDAYKYRFGNVAIEPGKDGGKGSQLYKKYLTLLEQLSINSNGGTLVGNMIEVI